MINITESIIWDESLPLSEQSIDAQNWIAQNVYPLLAYDPNSTGVQPTWDNYGRPLEWVVEFETFTVNVKWEYIREQSSDWAKSQEIITITGK